MFEIFERNVIKRFLHTRSPISAVIFLNLIIYSPHHFILNSILLPNVEGLISRDEQICISCKPAERLIVAGCTDLHERPGCMSWYPFMSRRASNVTSTIYFHFGDIRVPEQERVAEYVCFNTTLRSVIMTFWPDSINSLMRTCTTCFDVFAVPPYFKVKARHWPLTVSSRACANPV